MNIRQSFDWSTERTPEQPAVEVANGDASLTYHELQDRTKRVAEGFSQREVTPADTVLLYSPNCPEMIVTLLTAWRIGQVVSPINSRAPAAELPYYASDSDANVVVFHESLRDRVEEAGSDLEPDLFVQIGGDPPGWADGFDDLLDHEPVARDPDIDGSTPATIAYTGGTTGRPKGIPLDHEGRLYRALSFIYRDTIVERDNVGFVLPLYHSLGLVTLNAAFQANGTVVLLPPNEPETILETIAERPINTIQGVPTVFNALVNSDVIDEYDYEELREVTTAGQVASQELFESVTSKLGALFRNIYGTTETMHICYTREPTHAVGPSAHFQTARIVDPDANDPEATVDQGEIGEVIARMDGPEVFDGYRNKPGKTAAVVHDGWFFTEDLAYEDDDGKFWIVGRIDDMIISGGENIAPSEVEDVLQAHEAVADVGVVGTQSKKWGEEVVAFVVADDVTAETLDSYCQESALADFKRPRSYHFVEEIPKTAVGKTDRLALEEMADGE